MATKLRFYLSNTNIYPIEMSVLISGHYKKMISKQFLTAQNKQSVSFDVVTFIRHNIYFDRKSIYLLAFFLDYIQWALLCFQICLREVLP